VNAITVDTPTGPFHLIEEDGALVTAGWGRRGHGPKEETPLLAEARRQLLAYFERRLQRFDLPLRTGGTPLEEGVWREMRAIPFGETRTYGDLARKLGSNARVVGTACGRNAIPIIIPCHRVIGSDGRMTGFSGGEGIETKRALLTLEGALLL